MIPYALEGNAARRLGAAIVCLLLMLGRAQLAGGQTDPQTPAAHDEHQGLLIAAKPYVTSEASKPIFGKHTPYEGGILALDVYFRNERDTPIELNLDTVSLSIGPPDGTRQKLNAIPAGEVADRTLLKKPISSYHPRLPITLPGSTGHPNRSKEWQEFEAVLESAAMESDVLPPHMTVHGFFYFDIDRHFEYLSNASLEVSDLESMVDHQALLFFDVDLSATKP